MICGIVNYQRLNHLSLRLQARVLKPWVILEIIIGISKGVAKGTISIGDIFEKVRHFITTIVDSIKEYIKKD